MAFLDKVLKKGDVQGGDIDIEEFLNNLDTEAQDLYENADAFVKPMTLDRPEDVEAVSAEVKKGNIVLLNIENLAKRNAIRLRELVTLVKNVVDEIDGDIARISHERVLVTPARIKIIKKR